MLNIVILSKSHLKKFKEYKLALILIIAVVFVSFSQSSIGIGTATPNPTAILEVRSTNKGFLPPRMDNIEMNDINSPVEGLMVYCTSCSPEGIYVYDGVEFRHLLFFKKKIETFSIADVQTSIGSTFFEISPTLIPNVATATYTLIGPPKGVVSISGRKVSIDADMTIGKYNITVKATGNGNYTGEVQTSFTLTLVPNDDFVIPFKDVKFEEAVKTALQIVDSVRYSHVKNKKVLSVSKNERPSSEKINNMTGIEYFTALSILYCDSNALTTLDVSHNTALTFLSCSSNNLTSLDVSQNTALLRLYCFGNALTTLDVSKNTDLTFLNCFGNALTTLDLSQNTALTSLSCSDNTLTALDVSQNTALTFLSCHNNEITALDLSQNTALTTLSCSDNNLTTLDLSQNTALTTLSCSDNNLTTLDVSKNTGLTTLDCSSNALTTLDARGIRYFNTDSYNPLKISVGNLEVFKVHENIKNSPKIVAAKSERGNNLTISTYSAAAGSTDYIQTCADYDPRNGGNCNDND